MEICIGFIKEVELEQSTFSVVRKAQGRKEKWNYLSQREKKIVSSQ